MNGHNNNKAARFHSELMDGENHGTKRKGVSSITGTFHGRPCPWFLLLAVLCVSDSLEARRVGILPQADRPPGRGGQDCVAVLPLLSCAPGVVVCR